MKIKLLTRSLIFYEDKRRLRNGKPNFALFGGFGGHVQDVNLSFRELADDTALETIVTWVLGKLIDNLPSPDNPPWDMELAEVQPQDETDFYRIELWFSGATMPLIVPRLRNLDGPLERGSMPYLAERIAQHAMLLTRGDVHLSHAGSGMFLLRNEACRQAMAKHHYAECLPRG